MKIYIVIVNQYGERYTACDWCGDAYEEERQEVFLTREHAETVAARETAYDSDKSVTIHEFEV